LPGGGGVLCNAARTDLRNRLGWLDPHGHCVQARLSLAAQKGLISKAGLADKYMKKNSCLFESAAQANPETLDKCRFRRAVQFVEV
jgi:hypothetical protein